MDILRDMLDLFVQWVLEASDRKFAAGCGCLLFVFVLILAAVFAAGWFWGR